MSTEVSSQIATGRKARRRFRNLLLRPDLQMRTAVMIFGVGFMVVSILFGYMVRRVSDVTNQLALMAPDSTQAAELMGQSSLLLWVTYIMLMIAFFCLAIVLAVVITARYLGPSVAIRMHIARMMKGDFGGEVRLRRGDQLHDIAEDLNKLTVKMKEERAS